MSQEVREYLNSRGVAMSRSTPYNPAGNGQVERYNGVIWRAVNLTLSSKGLPVSMWECVLPSALHSVRSLLCTSTNSTPHERMFNFSRRSSFGKSIPTWLTSQGKVLLKNFTRQSKYDPAVEEVELVEANPEYAFVRFPCGRESTVSLKHLAPLNKDTPVIPEITNNRIVQNCNERIISEAGPSDNPTVENVRNDNSIDSVVQMKSGSGEISNENAHHLGNLNDIGYKRSSRIRKEPSYLKDYVKN